MVIESSYPQKFKRWFWYIIILLLGVPTLIFLLKILWHGRWDTWTAVQIFISLSFPFTLGLRLLFRFLPLLGTRITADAKSLKLHGRYSTFEIDWNQVRRVSPSQWPVRLGGGLQLYLKSGQVVFLPSLLTEFSELSKFISRQTGQQWGLEGTFLTIKYIDYLRSELIFYFFSRFSIVLLYAPLISFAIYFFWPDYNFIALFSFIAFLCLFFTRSFLEKIECFLYESFPSTQNSVLVYIYRFINYFIFYALLYGVALFEIHYVR